MSLNDLWGRKEHWKTHIWLCWTMSVLIFILQWNVSTSTEPPALFATSQIGVFYTSVLNVSNESGLFSVCENSSHHSGGWNVLMLMFLPYQTHEVTFDSSSSRLGRCSESWRMKEHGVYVIVTAAAVTFTDTDSSLLMCKNGTSLNVSFGKM